MGILIGILITLEVIVSLLLILIILVQPSKSGGGLGGAAFGGGGMGEQLFGARAGNVLTRGTILFSVIFLVNTLALAMLYSKSGGVHIEPAPVVQQQPQGLPAAPSSQDVAPVDMPADMPVDVPDMSEIPAVQDIQVDVPPVDAPVEVPAP